MCLRIECVVKEVSGSRAVVELNGLEKNVGVGPVKVCSGDRVLLQYGMIIAKF